MKKKTDKSDTQEFLKKIVRTILCCLPAAITRGIFMPSGIVQKYVYTFAIYKFDAAKGNPSEPNITRKGDIHTRTTVLLLIYTKRQPPKHPTMKPNHPRTPSRSRHIIKTCGAEKVKNLVSLRTFWYLFHRYQQLDQLPLTICD